MGKISKSERIKSVNIVIKEIASCGRRFFHHKGQVADLFERNNKLWYKCEWISDHKPVYEICLSVPDYRSYKGFFHGGTLEFLIKSFARYINTGDMLSIYQFGGKHWGYDKDALKQVHDKAIEQGVLLPF